MKVLLAIISAFCIGYIAAETCSANTVSTDCAHTHCQGNGMTLLCINGTCLCEHDYNCVQASECHIEYGSCSSNNFQQGEWHCVDQKCACSFGWGSIGHCLDGNWQDCLGAIGRK